MTLVFKRESDTPQSHALVIGAGCFPYLKGQNPELMPELRVVTDVTSPPNNARAMAQWLLDTADRLNPPLGSLELLISEADGSQASFSTGPASPDPGQSYQVDAATGDNVSAALAAWLGRAASDPDNLGVFYVSSHGMQAQEHILLLEDAGADTNDPWRNVLSLNHIQRNLYAKLHTKSVVFADSCRNLLEEASGLLDPITGRTIGNITAPQLAAAMNDPARNVYLLRASPYGATVKATTNGRGYFTEALLKCLRGGAGENLPQFGWCISPSILTDAVKHAGRFGLNIADIDLRPVDEGGQWEGEPIVILNEPPKLPVRVREAEPADDGLAALALKNTETSINVSRNPVLTSNRPLCAWVPPSVTLYEATGLINGGHGIPPVQLVREDILVWSRGYDLPLRRP